MIISGYILKEIEKLDPQGYVKKKIENKARYDLGFFSWAARFKTATIYRVHLNS